jgi:stage III sporulation protein AA
MTVTKTKNKATRALELIGGSISEEIIRLSESRRQGLSGLREICLRAQGRSSLLFSDERVSLVSKVSIKDTERILERLCEGALYAYRDSIAKGYVTVEGGIRVGIGGYAKYEHRSIVGVSDIRSLIFRIPGQVCDFSEELVKIYRSASGRGILIYSAPGVGKTTALRALALALGSGRDALRVAVVDERCEFDEEDYRSAEVDILKGYTRKRGLEIATRTLSPEVLMIDEIGADDAAELVSVVRCGIPLVATAHASGFDELMAKPSLKPLFETGAFSVFVGIFREGGSYSLTVDKI